jgi:hypothetical protein
MSDQSSGAEGFASPPTAAGGAGQNDEDAGVQFTAPSEGLEEQAPVSAPSEALSGIPSQLMDAKSAVEQALREQGREQEGSPRSVESFDVDGAANIQGVAIGMSEPGGPGEPGAPVLSVYVAEPATQEQVRSVVVESMGAQAAGDVPINVVTSGVIEARSHTFRIRPAPGGVSVGHIRVTAGTIGCLSVGRSAPRDSRLMVLSNNHVLANSNSAGFGDPVVQPGTYDGGSHPADQIAILERFVPIRFGGPVNYVDCATAWCWPDRVRPELIYYYYGWRLFRISNQVAWAQLGMNVGKSGRTTQLTVGRVAGLNWSGWINYGVGYAYFANQIDIRGYYGDFSRPGDSGSSIWTWDSVRRPVGLLFAGGGGVTIANPMWYVVSALDINLYT